MVKIIIITLSLFISTLQLTLANDNRKNLEGYLLNPDSLCNCQDLQISIKNLLCYESAKNFIKRNSELGYEVVSERFELNFLDSNYQIHLFEIKFIKNDSIVTFGFWNNNELKFVIQGAVLRNPVELKGNYVLLDYLISNPDSINNYKLFRKGLVEKDMIKIIKEKFQAGYQIIGDSWYFIGRPDVGNDCTIIIQSKIDSTELRFKYIKDNNNWKIFSIYQDPYEPLYYYSVELDRY